MKIIAPVNTPKEVEEIVKAGADEIYCGVLSRGWLTRYTNVASPNRREWGAANLNGFEELKEVVDAAHRHHVRVFLTLNALYTEKQYPLIYEQIEEARKSNVDALIVADLGLLLTLKKQKIGLEIHISTGGTTFNSQTAKFYEELGASRIVLPRHLQIQEMREMVKSCPSLKFEAFILNSGCKNIDGFCTFQHGVNEVLHRNIWNVPKKMNFDRHFLNAIRCLPEKIAQNVKGDMFGVDSACLLNYEVSFVNNSMNINTEKKRVILKNIASSFNFLSGVDTCGACRLAELEEIGVYGIKIVGRNYSTSKKTKDIRFLKAILSSMRERVFEKKDFKRYAKDVFKGIYKVDCGELCYYPDLNI